jgi:hypothetical protein
MIATMIVSHGHLIMKEIMTHWPTEDSWEGRLETALYTQRGLFFAGSFVVGFVILIRWSFAKAKDEQISRRELSQREKHERAAAQRHDALMASLSSLAGGNRGDSKKSHSSRARPR